MTDLERAVSDAEQRMFGFSMTMTRHRLRQIADGEGSPASAQEARELALLVEWHGANDLLTNDKLSQIKASLDSKGLLR